MAHLTDHKAWCSTLVNDAGSHVGGEGNWGTCGPGCPIPPDPRNSSTTTQNSNVEASTEAPSNSTDYI